MWDGWQDQLAKMAAAEGERIPPSEAGNSSRVLPREIRALLSFSSLT